MNRTMFGAAAAAALSLAAPACAEAWRLHDAVGAPKALKLTGSFRARFEALDGAFRPNTNPSDDIVSLRSTLFAEYATGPVRFGAEVYDSRVYGANLRTPIGTTEVDTLDLVQAYVLAEFEEPFGAETAASLQAGRMLLNLGSRRLVAADDYRNTTNSYTGVKLELKGRGGAAATLVYTLPQMRRPDDLPSLVRNRWGLDKESFDLVLWGGIASAPVGRTTLEAAFFGLDEHDAPGRATRDRALRTASARVIRNPQPRRFDYEVEGAYQYGTVRASTQPTARRLDVSAWFLHADAGYQFAGAWKPRVSIEYDLATGDDSRPGYRRFDTLFGMRRGDWAPSSIFAATNRANISSPGVRVEVTPSRRLDALATYRPMWAESAVDTFATTGVGDPAGRSGKYAGEQLEGRVRYWIVPDQLRLEINGAVLFKDALLKRAPNAPRTGDTTYISTALTASF